MSSGGALEHLAQGKRDFDLAVSGRVSDHVDQARTLLDESFVFDFVPGGEPCILTERQRAVMMEALAREESLVSILRLMHDDRSREIVTDPGCAGAVGESWQSSGVKVTLNTLGATELEVTKWDAIVRDAAYWYSRARSQTISICTTSEHLEALMTGRVPGIILGLQDAAALGEDPRRLEVMDQLGVRVIQLTYNSRNLIGDGCMEPSDGGLSQGGRRLIAEMNRRGIVVDVSHCGRQTTLDAIRLSSAPVAVTHSFCRTVFDHPRGKDDDVLRALRDQGGYFGIAVAPSFLRSDGKATLSDFAEQVAHAIELVGIDRVGIGTDYGWTAPDLPRELVEMARRKFLTMGFTPESIKYFGEGIPGFEYWHEWPNIPAALLAMGLSKGEVQALIGGNWLRFFRRVTNS